MLCISVRLFNSIRGDGNAPLAHNFHCFAYAASYASRTLRLKGKVQECVRKTRLPSEPPHQLNPACRTSLTRLSNHLPKIKKIDTFQAQHSRRRVLLPFRRSGH